MRAFIIAFLIIALSGCGMFRKVFKSTEHSKLEIISETKKDSTGTTVDRSVITEKSKIDTLIKVTGKIVKQDTPFILDSLVKGLTAIQNELIDVRMTLNPITGILSTQAYLKPITIPFRYDHEKVTQNNITQRSEQSEYKKAIVKRDEGKSIVEKEPISLKYYIGFLLISVAVISFVFWIKRKS